MKKPIAKSGKTVQNRRKFDPQRHTLGNEIDRSLADVDAAFLRTAMDEVLPGGSRIETTRRRIDLNNPADLAVHMRAVQINREHASTDAATMASYLEEDTLL